MGRVPQLEDFIRVHDLEHYVILRHLTTSEIDSYSMLAHEEIVSLCTTVIWLMSRFGGNRLQTTELAFLALLGLGVFLHMAKPFRAPFVLAIPFAYLLMPDADFLLRTRVPRIVASALVFLVCELRVFF